MSNYTAILLAVLIGYILINFVVGIYISKKRVSLQEKGGFISHYFIGNRSMGGIVLAMTLVATFTSASSFIGGPGIAYTKGLVWVYLSMIQVPTAFIILAILGKKFGMISRKIGAVTVTDYLKERYQSKTVAILASICLVIFFIAQMMSQFIGGAVLFQEITGLSYIYGLALFGIVVILYTAFGGFRAVVITDTIQGIIMVLGGFIMIFTIIHVAGGTDMLLAKLNTANPHWSDIAGDGATPKAFVMSFWVLVGIGVLGLPQTAVRAMGFKDTKALHKAMIYGSLVVGFLMIVMHISGVFAPAVLALPKGVTPDHVIPRLVLQHMHPVVAGLFIAAPLAAVMSTVSSLLLLASAGIVKDIYHNYVMDATVKDTSSGEKKISKLSIFTTLVVGIIVFVFTVYPPDLIVWINLFAMGGLECAFFCPIIFGLYWKKANATGAVISMLCGVVGFLLLNQFKVSMFGTTAIVPGILISVLTFVVGSLVGKKTSDDTLKLFFDK